MTYTKVNMVIEGVNPEVLEEYKEYLDFINDMNKLRMILAKKRQKRGSVNFDFPEAKIILDKDGKVIDIKPYERNAATNLIEEFMLVCNETVAEDYYWQEAPFVYRNHDVPDGEKVETMKKMLRTFGYRIKGQNEVHPKEIQNILSEIEGKQEEHVISRIVLRSMKQARYQEENIGHFGLAAKYYCHFTSPIRRYPDLQIHRIIKEILGGELTSKRAESYERRLPEICKQCSSKERLAEESERETDKLKMVEYMQDRIGQDFDGIISGVTGWGIYIELENTIEGMVSLNSMSDDFYNYDEESIRVVGERKGKTYSLGNRVRVRCVKADKETRTIDFQLIED